jgi:succinoglycan biosynthesis protein ExoU
MSERLPEAICVIIAAKNAASTISAAISSALSQHAVAEVVVVDDGSTDETAAAAKSGDDGTGRLRVTSLPVNRGPAAARNHAIAHSNSPLIAILDADDFFFPGRFEAMLQHDDWDLIADNIAFTQQASGLHSPEAFQARPRCLSTLEFIEGNISQAGLRRGEIGFLKPVMRRSFLERFGLYLRALVKGARYTIIEHCGYAAVVRADSLSGRHRTEDLRRLYEADAAVRQSSTLPADVAAALQRHENHIRDRYVLRAFLDSKKQGGIAGALRYALRHPASAPAIAAGIFRDKTHRLRQKQPAAAPQIGYRYLLPGIPAAQK